MKKNEISKLLEEFNSALEDYERFRAEITLDQKKTKEVLLGDKSLFSLFIGKRVLKGR